MAAPVPEVVLARHVLIVDDEHAVRHVISRYLSRRGWTVAQAINAAEALAILQAPGHEIEAVIIDLHLPGLSGSALCRRISEEHPALATRLIVASGDAGAARQELARESMTCPVLGKPFELSELDAALARVTAA